MALLDITVIGGRPVVFEGGIGCLFTTYGAQKFEGKDLQNAVFAKGIIKSEELVILQGRLQLLYVLIHSIGLFRKGMHK